MTFGQDKLGHDELQEKLRELRLDQEERQAKKDKFGWIATIGVLVISFGSLGFVGFQYLPESKETIQVVSVSEAKQAQAERMARIKTVPFSKEAMPPMMRFMANRAVANAKRAEADFKRKGGCKDGGAAGWAENTRRIKKSQKAAKNFLETKNPFAAISMIRNGQRGALAGMMAMNCLQKDMRKTERDARKRRKQRRQAYRN